MIKLFKLTCFLILFTLPGIAHANTCKLEAMPGTAIVHLQNGGGAFAKLCDRNQRNCVKKVPVSTPMVINHQISRSGFPLIFISYESRSKNGRIEDVVLAACQSESFKNDFKELGVQILPAITAFLGVLLTFGFQAFWTWRKRTLDDRSKIQSWVHSYRSRLSFYKTNAAIDIAPPEIPNLSHATFPILSGCMIEIEKAIPETSQLTDRSNRAALVAKVEALLSSSFPKV